MTPWKHQPNTASATHYTSDGKKLSAWVCVDEYGAFWDSGIDTDSGEKIHFGRSASKAEAMARCEVYIGSH